jgi:hypothetical protein
VGAQQEAHACLTAARQGACIVFVWLTVVLMSRRQVCICRQQLQAGATRCFCKRTLLGRSVSDWY